MSKNNIEAIYPLSPLQQGLLFHALYDPESEDYFEQLSCTIQGALDVPAFIKSWQQILDRHPVLRTVFMWQGLDEPLQVVRQRVTAPFEQQDWSSLSQAEQQQRLDQWLHDDRRRGFKLSLAPLMRLALMQLGEQQSQFVWSSHHLLLDGWSFSLVLKEVFAYYGAYSEGRELEMERSRPFRDYIAWLQQQEMAKAEGYWRQMLKGFTAPTVLGIGSESAISFGQKKIYLSIESTISAEVTAGLQRLARQQQLTLNTLVQGAWALLLSRYSGECDVLFGTVVSGRPASLPGVEQMVGLFINTLPFRVRIEPGQRVTEWLKGLQEQQVEMRQYEYSPLVEVQGWSDVPRGVSLFDSILVFENYPMDKALQDRGGELKINDSELIERTNYPITVSVVPDHELYFRINYDGRTFEEEAIKRMAGHFQTLLEGIIANPDQRLSELSLLTQPELRQLSQWSETTPLSAPQELAHRNFEVQAALRPEALALICGEEQLSYRELNESANQLAHYLHLKGLIPHQRVGVLMERSAQLVMALLALFKAGLVYVPLDPAYPEERLRFMLKDADLSLLLSTSSLSHLLTDTTVPRLCLDQLEKEIEEHSRENLPPLSAPDTLAYLIYTSGSSGEPKAVMVEQGNLAHTLSASQQQFHLSGDDRMLSLSSFSFDISLLEMLLPLSSGGAVELVRREQVMEIEEVVERAGEATVLHAVPTLMQQIVSHLQAAGEVTGQQDNAATMRHMRQVFVGGEAVSPHLLHQMQEVFPAAQLHVLYGPTEATIICCSQLVSAQTTRQMVGRPLAGVGLSIRDGAGQEVAVGVSGELYISGGGVSRGYLHQRELTAQKYVEMEGERWYRSGDRVRWLADGSVEYLGRVDEQVKVRGYRIEVGEIESLLQGHAGVSQAIVMAREDCPGEKRLVAYVVAAEGAEVTVSGLRRHLEEQLPEYMIPSAFVMLDALPLTSNGKVDKRALTAPDSLRPELAESYMAPRTEVERVITSVWQEVLKIESVGINDNFFDLGGNSLLAIQAHDKLKGNLERHFPMVELFKYPTVNSLAKFLGHESDGKSSFQKVYDRAEKQRAVSNRQRQLAGRRG